MVQGWERVGCYQPLRLKTKIECVPVQCSRRKRPEVREDPLYSASKGVQLP